MANDDQYADQVRRIRDAQRELQQQQAENVAKYPGGVPLDVQARLSRSEQRLYDYQANVAAETGNAGAVSELRRRANEAGSYAQDLEDGRFS